MSARRRCATRTCRHAPSSHAGDGCRLCDCTGWVDRKRHSWREEVHTAWFFAMHAWSLAAEEAALGYQTELAEFAELHPRPRLQDFMRALSPGALPEDLEELTKPIVVCPHCHGTGRAA